jgi:repressor LexA
MAQELSLKRKRILDFITSFTEEKGYAPSVRDIVRACGISSTSVAQYHINVLERDGFIRRTREVSRSITLTGGAAGPRKSIPVLGTIAAGEPIPVPREDTWSAGPVESLDLSALTGGGFENVYALKVKGASLIEDLISDGDIVVMQPAAAARDGDTVAVWLKDRQEVTLKKIHHEPDRVCLSPANSSMQPIYCRPEDVEIQGKVIAVIRKLTG